MLVGIAGRRPRSYSAPDAHPGPTRHPASTDGLRAREQEYHVIVAGIDRENQASIALHEAIGFEPAGTIRHAGFKFGRWLDLGFWQFVLDTPRTPRDG